MSTINYVPWLTLVDHSCLPLFFFLFPGSGPVRLWPLVLLLFLSRFLWTRPHWSFHDQPLCLLLQRQRFPKQSLSTSISKLIHGHLSPPLVFTSGLGFFDQFSYFIILSIWRTQRRVGPWKRKGHTVEWVDAQGGGHPLLTGRLESSYVTSQDVGHSWWKWGPVRLGIPESGPYSYCALRHTKSPFRTRNLSFSELKLGTEMTDERSTLTRSRNEKGKTVYPYYL